MSKRPSQVDGDEKSSKRPRLQDHAAPTEAKSAEHLRELLSFRQDALPQLLAGTRALKSILDSILYTEDKASILKQQAILHEYLDHEKPQDDEDRPLKQLFQAWSFATEVNHDNLCSAIPALFALLLKAISSILDLREFGLALAKTLLREEQLRLITRGLGANKEKEHVISPCLRLLNEIATFDGGALTVRIHAVRHAAVDARLISRCLSLSRSSEEFHESGAEKPTVRANCIRYLLSLLKLSPPPAKDSLLRSTSIWKSFFSNLSQDSPIQLTAFLIVIKEHVLDDEGIDKGAKAYFLNSDRLLDISKLYRVGLSADSSPTQKALVDHVHKFLHYVCTDSKAGILRKSSGFYPPNTERAEAEDGEETMIDLGLDSVSWYDSFDIHVPVYNNILSRFLKSLKPYASNQERKLMVSIFEVCPELTADYFRSSKFSFDPKLTNTWTGYAAFLFSVLQTRLPSNFGRRDNFGEVPPPVSILLDNTLPAPMNQKVLVRCLNQSSELISFCTIRLLVASLQRLRMILHGFDKASRNHGSLWVEGRERLVNGFTQRCPSLRDIVALYHKTPKEKIIQHEAILRLLRLYYEITPQLVTEQKFDISLPFNHLLSTFATRDDDPAQSVSERSEHTMAEDQRTDNLNRLHALELSHLLSIAARTPDTRWFHKPEALPFSPFTCLLTVQAKISHPPVGSFALLAAVASDNDILQAAELDALILSLQFENDSNAHKDMIEWLDDVLQRYVRKPIKYQDDLDEFGLSNGSSDSVSPFWMALKEQWPFALERRKSSDTIATMLRTFLSACHLAGESPTFLTALRESFKAAAQSKPSQHKILEFTDQSITDLTARFREMQHSHNTSQSKTELQQITDPTTASKKLDSSSFELPPDPAETNASASMHKTLNTPLSDLTEIVSSGVLSQLVLCLSSTDNDVRAQARANLRSITKKLGLPKAESQMPSAKQLWLLLGILENTAIDAVKDVDSGGNDQLPYMVTAFASMAAPVLTTPANPLYEQINRFLLRGPTFSQTRILSYWRHDLLRRAPPESAYRHSGKPFNLSAIPPDTDTSSLLPTTIQPLPLTALPSSLPFRADPYHNGIHFLLSYIYHAIRSEEDLAILRSSSDVIESMLALAGSDNFLPRGLRELVIAVLWRVTCVEDGSTMLITRAGIISWLAMIIDRRGEGRGAMDLVGKAGLKQLLLRIWDTCAQDAVRKWDGSGLDSLRDAIGPETWKTCDQQKAQNWLCGVEATIQSMRDTDGKPMQENNGDNAEDEDS